MRRGERLGQYLREIRGQGAYGIVVDFFFFFLNNGSNLRMCIGKRRDSKERGV